MIFRKPDALPSETPNTVKYRVPPVKKE